MCRHAAKESLSVLANGIMKQRRILVSCFLGMVPRTLRSDLLRAPISEFVVAPRETVSALKQRFDNHIQSKALLSAVLSGNSGNSVRSWRFVKKGGLSSYRGGRGSYPVRRGSYLDRLRRGSGRFPSRRGSSLSRRNRELFRRRDRMTGTMKNPVGSAGPSGESQQ